MVNSMPLEEISMNMVYEDAETLKRETGFEHFRHPQTP